MQGLLSGGDSEQTQARWTPEQGRGTGTRHLIPQGVDDKEMLAFRPGTRARAGSNPGSSLSARLPTLRVPDL